MIFWISSHLLLICNSKVINILSNLNKDEITITWITKIAIIYKLIRFIIIIIIIDTQGLNWNE